MARVATATATLTALRPASARLVRVCLWFAALGLFVLAVADGSMWWRTRHAAHDALTALTEEVEEPAATGPASDSAADGGRCTIVGLATDSSSVPSLCAAKAATGLPGLDVRIRIRAREGLTVACAMVHQRSATGLLGGLVDRVTTARRVVAVDAGVATSDGLRPMSEAPFAGHDWGFCDGGRAGAS
jgi:hypothetical protein